MIFAFTGQPGAGKTLGAIKFALEDDQFKNRPVFVFGINGINVTGWEVIDKKQVLTWWKLPEGSVVIIDECQDIMRPRHHSKDVPIHIQKLEKHRHLGFDFILTFQFPTQIDTVVRHLITDHFHGHRSMGLSASTVYKWDKLCLDPSSRSQQKLATKTTLPFDKKIYDLYQSSSLHTAKVRLPKSIYLLPILIIAFSLIIFKIYKFFTDDEVDQLLAIDIVNAEAVYSPSSDVFIQDDPKDFLLAQLKPVLENDPSSAPIYSELKQPVSFPRPNCISGKPQEGRSICQCYSQQATVLDIDTQTCIHYVTKGYGFDYTRPDYQIPQNENGEPASEFSSRGSPFALIDPVKPPISIPPNDNQVRHPR